jgi:hypothetical protein
MDHPNRSRTGPVIKLSCWLDSAVVVDLRSSVGRNRQFYQLQRDDIRSARKEVGCRVWSTLSSVQNGIQGWALVNTEHEISWIFLQGGNYFPLGSGLENGRRDPLRWPRNTLYLQKSALAFADRGGCPSVYFACGLIATRLVIARKGKPFSAEFLR